jgi:hypothetical protein
MEHTRLHPIEAELITVFLKIVQKHGNGLWAFEELEWLVYIENIDKYESLNEEDKFILNAFMKAFRSLYK